ncbi:MAG: hypothetical protein ACYCVC_12885 [Acidimicrobiales bacterium]
MVVDGADGGGVAVVDVDGTDVGEVGLGGVVVEVAGGRDVADGVLRPQAVRTIAVAATINGNRRRRFHPLGRRSSPRALMPAHAFSKWGVAARAGCW